MALATAVRIDHVMGLHRLYWVPYGLDATQGVYVRYHPEEMYAILTLEAARAGALVVGEDLGTVPPGVRSSMARHGVHRTHVLQLEAIDPEDVLPEPPHGSVASLNTHDLWPFASFQATHRVLGNDPSADGVGEDAAQRDENAANCPA